MRKKLSAMVLILSMLLSLVACDKTTEVVYSTENSNQQNNAASGEIENNNDKQPNRKDLDIVQGSVFNEGVALVSLRAEDI